MFGYANNHIVNEVDRFVHVSKRTVQCVIKEWCIPGGHETRHQNGGWRKIISQWDQKQFSCFVNKNLLQAWQELLQSVNKGPFQPVSE